MAERPAASARQHWLLKSEPGAWSWDEQVARGAAGEEWSGVRNYQARNNMRAMRLGDLGFFYHSVDEKRIVGIVRVCRLAHPDSKDATGKWECVDVAALAALPRPVGLEEIKATPELAGMVLVNNSRLSVQPVSEAEWRTICRLGGLDADRLATPAAARKRARAGAT